MNTNEFKCRDRLLFSFMSAFTPVCPLFWRSAAGSQDGLWSHVLVRVSVVVVSGGGGVSQEA